MSKWSRRNQTDNPNQGADPLSLQQKADLARSVEVLTADLETTRRKLAAALAARERAATQTDAVERRSQALIEHSSEGIALIAADGTLSYVSPAGRQMFGRAFEENIGRSAFLFVHSEDLYNTTRLFAEILDSPNRTITTEFRYLHGDGSWRWIEAVGHNLLAEPSVASIVVNYRDVTQRKTTEQRLRESEQRFRIASEMTSDYAYSFTIAADGKLNTEWVVGAVERITGYSPAELQSLRSYGWSLVHPDDQPLAIVRVQKLLRGEADVSDFRIVTRAGEVRWLREHGQPEWSEAEKRVVRICCAAQDVTAQHAVELALRDSESRFRSLAQSARDAIVCADAAGRIVFWNSEAEKVFGYSQAEIIGKPLTLLVPEHFREAHQEGLHRVTIGGEKRAIGRSLKVNGLRKDGTVFPLELSLSSSGNAAESSFSAVLRDVSQRRSTQGLLQHRRELERLIGTVSTNFINLAPAEIDAGIDSALEAIGRFAGMDRGYVFLFSADGSTADNSHEWCVEGIASQKSRLQRLSTTRFPWWMNKLRDLESIYIPHAGDLPPEAAAALHLGESPHLESIVIVPMVSGSTLLGFLGFHTNGASPPWAEADIALLKMVGEIFLNALERKRAHAALEDERQLLERRVEERTADLSAANAELARTARLKDEFLANISHELRTPLNAVLAISEALQEQVYGPTNERQMGALHNIEESGRHLLSLINDVLDIAKVGGGTLQLDIGPVSVQSICDSALRLVREAAMKKNVRVTCTIRNVEFIQADERRLKQILLNLLSNAVKFSSANGAIGLDVRGDSQRQAVDFTVRDEGIGIATDDLPQLFRTFVQLDSTLARQYEGTGLGLALVQRMTELHGGSVTVDSAPGKGSRFTVSLPWKPGAHAVRQPNEVQPLPMLRQALIVEDSSSAAERVGRYLTELGAAAVTHPQGNGALERAIELQPDVIILDLLLPDRTGWQVIGECKSHPETRHIPIVVVSVVDDRRRALELGASDYIVKPVTRSGLRSAILGVLPNGGTGQTALVLSPQDQPSVSAPLVLLAEDNETSLSTLSQFLIAKGYRLAQARNGQEAVERATETNPNVILMDVQMPGMDGLEATRQIRQSPPLADIPIVAITALAMPGDRERCLSAGANDYLSKPLSLKTLVEVVENHLAARRSSR